MHALAQTSKATRQTRSTASTSFFTPSRRQLQRACACSGTVARSGCTQCAAERGESADAPPIVDQALQSPGRPLDTATQAFFEARFNVDFGHVRVHTDATAGESARSVDAKAYTVGPDVVFGAGQFAPGSAEGRSLLAHELTHVVQQGGGGPGLAATGAHAVQRTPTFKDCKTKEKGKEDAKEKIIAKAVADAAPLAQAALDRFQGVWEADKEAFDAFNANFGKPDDAKVKRVVQVYGDIKKSLDSKSITCVSKCEPDKGGKDEKGDICARGSVGKDEMWICPEFFRKPCADLQPSVILHEAAHNAGAGGNQDVDPKKKAKYPPKDAENNAYSYQHFAEAIQSGAFKPRGSGPMVKEREVKPSK